MDVLQILAFVGTFVAGAAFPIFVVHYQRFWDNCRVGADTARRVYRALCDIRDCLVEFEAAAVEGGRPGLYRKISSASARTKVIFTIEDSLFDLRDDSLEKDARLGFARVRHYLAHGLTDLMTTTDADDFRVAGTSAYAAREEYLRRIATECLPELEQLMKRVEPLRSPWGHWRRSLGRIVGRVFGIRFSTGRHSTDPVRLSH